MSDSNTAMPKEFARRLLAYEAALGGPAEANNSAGFRVCDRLRGPLAKLMGVAGFFALLSRALALAGAEIPWLREVRIKADGSVEGVSELEAKLDARAAAEGELIVVGHLLRLLVMLIGPALTVGLVHDIWPGWKITIVETQAL